MPIHPTAIVDPSAEIDPSADLGPHVVIAGPVHIGPRTRLVAGVYLEGDTQLGADNVLYPGATIGTPPQDLAYTDAATGVRIGDRNTFREHVVIHRGTDEGTHTVVGSDVYCMSTSHVGHNTRVGDHVILASGALLAGRCDVGERTFIGGNAAVHQHCRVGRLVIMRGLSRTSRDVPPFAMMDDTHVVRGVNRVGLERAGFALETVRALVSTFRILFRVRCNLGEAAAAAEAEYGTVAEVQEVLEFIRASDRGVAMGPPATRVARNGSLP